MAISDLFNQLKAESNHRKNLMCKKNTMIKCTYFLNYYTKK